mmetsp:Transcript_19989/g.41928  ORF Transcript_19989/g.41928 Transcript_19989/m.41928 type:complete len:81 (+) Transcript_19989:1342-1584(+)
MRLKKEVCLRDLLKYVMGDGDRDACCRLLSSKVEIICLDLECRFLATIVLDLPKVIITTTASPGVSMIPKWLDDEFSYTH